MVFGRLAHRTLTLSQGAIGVTTTTAASSVPMNGDAIQRCVTRLVHGNSSGRAPNIVGDVDDEAKLAALVVDSDRVADVVAGKPALRAQEELFERDELGGFIDPAFERVARLERRILAGEEAEDDALAVRDEAQGLEAAGARRVVFEEEDVRVEFLEQGRCHKIVAAFGAPMAAGIAPADVQADGHAGGPLCHRAIEQADIALDELRRLVSPALNFGPALGIA